MTAPDRAGAVRILRRGADPAEPAVALTFDDGPWPGSTEPILDALAAGGARAAFFVIGRYAVTHPALLRRIHEAGHLVANHSYDHARLGTLRGSAYWRAQLARTDDAVDAAVGARPVLFRPPMGLHTPLMMREVHSLGYTVVLWNCRTCDGVGAGPDRIVRRASSVRPGGIILMHDGRDPASGRRIGATAAALPEVIRRLRDRGLRTARLDELIAIPAYR